MPEVLSTRLFPKGEGADAVRITGVAARCDWVIASDRRPPFVTLHRRTAQPRTVFLSLRFPLHALRMLADELLPRIAGPFVVVSGSEDATVPHQVDRRWAPFDDEMRGAIARILAHPGLRRWHAENLDDGSDPRFSPLPLGRVFPDGDVQPLEPHAPATGTRPLRMLCSQRIRAGAQWDARRTVADLCRGPWRSWTTLLEEEVDEAGFIAEVRRHAFVLCVEGGGLDPSPKAWQAIEHGAIPIIRRTALAPAYGRLPVAMVPGWQADAIDAATLAGWRSRYAPAHDDPPRRADVVERLTLDYWWRRIEADLA